MSVQQEIIQRLRDWQKQIIHGSNTFGEIADHIETISAESANLRREAEELKRTEGEINDCTLRWIARYNEMLADRDRLNAENEKLRAARAHIGKVYACKCGWEWTKYKGDHHDPYCKSEVLAEFDAALGAAAPEGEKE